ncbi:hypothetical protein CLV78_110104 [Aliiruegeria haliotis]|uniref:Apple domain-containing protein n=1 Tax=Aliiruegeria haliotis TaxID=1280846 RepID=A0A2T0RJD8_9RHOB|nr:alpha-2-macroglobulin family protein [Aliiruegeria haliotis]PRY21230.1 hypothetical protein CLV78_110104 [Aliiruegeria haliotis]
MRRVLFRLLAFGLPLAISLSASAQPQDGSVPERRLVVERDTDFFGADLRSIFDTTYEACKTACLTDPSCGAFTFNTRSNSCFPKQEMTRREPYEGALSALVLRTPPEVMQRAAIRAGELDFLRPSDLEQARKEAEDLPRRHLAGGWSLEDLTRGGTEARSRGDHAVALRWIGAVIVLADTSGSWLDYADSALLAEGENGSQTRNLRARALPAAINAYLRAVDPPAQARALTLMARALEDARRGRDMLSALRLANQLGPTPEIAGMLSDAIGKYGFRITEHRVDSETAVPRICVTFSEKLAEGIDFEPYVQLPGQSFAVDASGSDLCIDGVEHGRRYQVTFRAGLPAASGEGMVKDVPLALYVRDRAPAVRFPGRAYVLPRTPDAALPIVTVNLSEVDLTLSRISDRSVVSMIQQDLFGRPLSHWEEQQFKNSTAEEVWSGTGSMEPTLNRDVTTLLPMQDAIAELPAGLYALQARIHGADPYDVPSATQWFVISDIGLASMSGADGLHVFARSLGSAAPLEGLEVALISRSNRVLDTATTDARGYAAFAPGLTLGRGGSAPALVTATMGEDDMGFLALTDPAFDLSDRGVEGRPAAGPVDVFLATDRGAYRAGEVIHATALARDGTATAIPGLPLTAILTRPDGVEYSRHTSADDRAGGHVFAMPVGGSVPRGTWKLAVHADPDAPALATRSLLVEDFLPERIDVDLALADAPIRLGDTPTLDITARYLFGAPGGDLPVEGEVLLRAAEGLADWPGYRFGRHDEPFDPRFAAIDTSRTDDKGLAQIDLDLPEVPDPARPLELRVTTRVSEGSGRPVERRLTRAMAPSDPLIGIRPMFDGVVPEGTEASFQIAGIGPEGAATPMRVKWTMNRVETRYQWYSNYGSWDWEPVTRRERIATGELSLGTGPSPLSAPVDWGQYELVVERIDGPYAASSTDFYAGWYAPADASASPDLLEVSLDKVAYRPGETAQLRIVPREAGKALVTVASNRLIDMQALELPEGETIVSLPVTDAWGAGAYVTATLIQPMDADRGRNPTRSLGLVHAQVDPGPAKLLAHFDVPDAAAPRAALDVVLRVEGVAPGETAFATIAAVDQGILNLTGFEPPDASRHFFGQRRLGMELRDIYGRLIDGQTGARGEIRSGGDAASEMRMESPPPTEELVAFFSGPLTIGEDGIARTSFDLPAFNGQVKLMAVVWSADAVGEASTDVLVRDPVVLSASVPRFLTPGDTSRLRLEMVHATGPAGDMAVSASGSGLTLNTAALADAIPLTEQGKATLSLPLRADTPGLAQIDISVTTPDGRALTKTLKIPVQVNDPEISTTARFTLAAGDSFTLSRDVFAGLRPGTGTATLALGLLGTLDGPGLLTALDRYPYGCTEQVTSQALPLLYHDQVASVIGLDSADRIAERIDGAIDKVLSRQKPGGGFGLWGAHGGDFWLDAYVTDFLSRARAQGHTVPQQAFAQAMDNLRNQLNYAADFDEGGEDVAYALMVLAREGAAPMGDLRYYADVKGDAFATPMAAAQIGSALAMYGDQRRADAMFSRAARKLLNRLGDETEQVWRADYGTNLRDSAAVLALAAQAGSDVVDRATLVERVASPTRDRSTQEATWTLLAAHALTETPDGSGFLVDGQPATGPLVRVLEDDTAARAITVTNDTGRDAPLTLTTFGVPTIPPDRQSYGYALERRYFTMEGENADPSAVPQGTRLVTVLSVTPFAYSEARLMIDDPLPAGFEIDNPSLLRSGDIKALDWLKTTETQTAEFRQDRFLAAVDWRSKESFNVAYIVRAVSPGSYHHPAASVADMYRPQFRASTDSGRVSVFE